MPKQEAKKEDLNQNKDRLIVPLVLAFIVVLFFMAVSIIYASGIELESSDFLMLGLVLLICSCALLIVPIFFRKAIFKIRISIYYAFVMVWLLMFISSAVLILSVMVPSRSAAAERMACEFNLHKLWTLLQLYKHNTGEYPPPQVWGDALEHELGVPEGFFICISARPARSHYSMNSNCKADSPDDVVLLFETKGGWNQHGGMELMDFEHHLGAVCNVLLNDGSVLYIQPTTMRLLNWGDKDGEQKAESGEQDTDGTTEEFAVNLKVGDDAPGFSLLAQDGETVNLSDCAGSKVLVYFYPKADTPGCTKQACSVRDSTEELKKAGVVVLGISPDEPNEQQKFDEKYSLGFRLLSDSEHKAAEAYSVWDEKNMYGKKFMGIIRSSFLIDENGKLIGVWYNVKPEETVPKAMAVVSR